MALVFHCTSLNLVPNVHFKTGYKYNSSNTAFRECGYISPAGPSSLAFRRKHRSFIRGLTVTKARKTARDKIPTDHGEEGFVDMDGDDEEVQWESLEDMDKIEDGEGEEISWEEFAAMNGIDENDSGPWDGAIVYKRNASISHVEYCTTLERLDLGSISSEHSKARASAMGLRVTKAVKDFPDGTPVLISIDVTRKRGKIRLDGIIRTVLELTCSSCGRPAPDALFLNFSLLLTEEPIQESEITDIEDLYREFESKNVEAILDKRMANDNDDDIDFEDRFYFPPDKKEIDISKLIRDLIHLEIRLNVVCDANCRGACLRCGANLNTTTCNCSEQEGFGVGFGVLGNLKKQLQRK